MNIKPEQLNNSLSDQLASLYFAFGAEILLVEQSLSLIKDAAKNRALANDSGLILMEISHGTVFLV